MEIYILNIYAFQLIADFSSPKRLLKNPNIRHAQKEICELKIV